MAKTTKANGVPAEVQTVRSAKLAPMQKRLARLRKQEAKRRRQLATVQARTAKTTADMNALITAIETWVQSPPAKAVPAAELSAQP